MIIETKLGQFTAEKAGQSKDGQPIYRLTSIPYAEADPFMPPVLRHNYPQEKLINSLETFCFPQKRILRWPNLYRGLRGSYHGVEIAMFFDNLDRMAIQETELNKEEIALIQNDWLSFIKNGAIPQHSLYNESKRIIHYSHPVKEISFPHQALIDRLATTGLFQRSMQDYLQAR